MNGGLALYLIFTTNLIGIIYSQNIIIALVEFFEMHTGFCKPLAHILAYLCKWV